MTIRHDANNDKVRQPDQSLAATENTVTADSMTSSNMTSSNMAAEHADHASTTDADATDADSMQPAASPVLSDNLQVLVRARNETINSYTQDILEIPAALVRLKWKNRREIYPLVVQEEIYGAVLQQIIQRYPQRTEQLLTLLEQCYQQIKQQEAATLMMARKLADGSYQAPALQLG